MDAVYLHQKIDLLSADLHKAVEQYLDFLLYQQENKQQDKDKLFTYIASEKTLAKDWLNDKEDRAWKDL